MSRPVPPIRIRVAVLVVHEGALLLVRHQKKDRTYWLAPGGGLEYGETIAQCAERELWEETGLQVRAGDLLFVEESIPPDGHRHVVNLFLLGTLLGGSLQLGQEPGLAEVQFVPLAEVPRLTIYPPVLPEMLAAIRDPHNLSPRLLGNRWVS